MDQKHMELKNDSSKVVGNKIAIQKSVAFLYTSNDKWKLKLKTQYHWKNVYSGLLPILLLICLFLILCCMSCMKIHENYIFSVLTNCWSYYLQIVSSIQ